MGTRAVITFVDENGEHSVYQHWDGDPQTVIERVLKSAEESWALPRFEADEFGARYCYTVVKLMREEIDQSKREGWSTRNPGGNIRLTKSHEDHWDLSYRYVVTCKKGKLHVEAYSQVYEEGKSLDEKPKYKKIHSGYAKTLLKKVEA